VTGWKCCLAGTVAVLAAACWGAIANGSIGAETGVTLVVSTILAAVLTRRGDLPLVVIFPPLAFMSSVLLAGQIIVDPAHSWRTRQVLMLVETLGRNARWVVAATITGAALVGLRTLIDSRRARKSPAGPAGVAGDGAAQADAVHATPEEVLPEGG
jgi:hypothetical protein